MSEVKNNQQPRSNVLRQWSSYYNFKPFNKALGLWRCSVCAFSWKNLIGAKVFCFEP